MKKLLIIGLGLISVNLLAIDFITEAEVQRSLGADKVIEVNKYAVEPLLQGNICRDAFLSRSGRAYVVKKGDESTLVLTRSGLRGLTECVKL